MQSDAPARQRVRILGEPVDLATPTDVLGFTARAVAARRKALVLSHTTDSLRLCRKHPEMRALYCRADLIEAASPLLVLWGRLTRKGIGARHRGDYLRWRDDFWRIAAANRWRVFYLGGAPGVAEAAAKRLAARWPGVQIATCHGHFDMNPKSDGAVYRIEAINAFRPDVVFVGMGMPRQEAWIAANYDALQAGVVFSVGAAFEHEAGVQISSAPLRTAPRRLGETLSLAGPAWADIAAMFSPKPTGSVSTRPAKA